MARVDLAAAQAIFAVIAAGCAQHPIRTSLCEIDRNPSRFDGKVVEVEAAILTDGHHGAWVEDNHCGKGAGFDADDRVIEAAGIRWTDMNPPADPRGEDRAIAGTIMGRLVARSGERMLKATRLNVRLSPAPEFIC